MTKPTRKQEEEFIRESNAIEREYDEESFVDAMEAWDYIKGKQILTLPEILETHRILMENQGIPAHTKGEWRTCTVFIGGRQGLNWQYIPNAMEDWVHEMNIPLREANWDAIDLHVEYEKIHPFIDGNGRTGRMFMNWHRLRNGLQLLTIKESEKEEYYKWF